MDNIVVVFSKPEDAKGVKGLLVKNGFSVAAACTSGAQALAQMDEWNDGIVICGYKLTDMMYSELHGCLPKGVDMLLMAPQRVMQECLGNDIVCLSMPLKVYDLLNTVSMMAQAAARRRRRARQTPRVRSGQELEAIREAKELLMARNNMTEEEAHRYIQKCSMDSGTNMTETAQMVLAMMKG